MLAIGAAVLGNGSKAVYLVGVAHLRKTRAAVCAFPDASGYAAGYDVFLVLYIKSESAGSASYIIRTSFGPYFIFAAFGGGGGQGGSKCQFAVTHIGRHCTRLGIAQTVEFVGAAGKSIFARADAFGGGFVRGTYFTSVTTTPPPYAHSTAQGRNIIKNPLYHIQKIGINIKKNKKRGSGWR